MKKSTNLTITLKSGVEVQVTVNRVQGYDRSQDSYDGISYNVTEYHDYAEIFATIAKVGITNQQAWLEGTMLTTYRKVGSNRQLVKVQLNNEEASAISALMSEVLSAEDMAKYEAVREDERKVDTWYEAHTEMMNKALED